MATGKSVSEFSLKFTSLTYSPGLGGSVIIQANYEGTGTGFGTIQGTGTFVGAKSGTFSVCTAAYLDDGEQLSAAGSGTYESSGKHRWRTQGFVQISDGRLLVSEGEIDLATKSWKGKLSERS
jgi:hypothetical protein